jgi:putative addiction module CopG family antidote
MTTIILTAEQEAIISERVNSGAYKSAAEVIAASLNLLKEQEKRIEAQRREIFRGVEDIKQGRFTTLSTDEELDRFADQIIEQSSSK